LIAIEPVLENLKGLGLDLAPQEEQVFRQLNPSFYWTMVLRNSGIPQTEFITPIDLSAQLGIPAPPLDQRFVPNPLNVPNLSLTFFSSQSFISDQQVQEQVLSIVNKLVKANGFTSAGQPEFVAFHNHSPFEATVSAEAIRGGFYRTMNALQGERNTHFTGAAWQAHNSAEIWIYNDEILLPQLVKSLKG